LLQPPFKDPIEDRSLGGGLCRQVIDYCVVYARDVVKVLDFEFLFQLLGMEQVGGQLGISVAALPLNLFDDQLEVALH
jgi:hypothetical protein